MASSPFSLTSTFTSPSISTALPSPTSILDGPNVDDNNCVLLGPFALFIQALMGILVILTLIYKRHRETPKRPWKIWSLDISKQMLGQAFVHTLNVLLSDSIARNDKGNPCALYFLNIAVDTTIGVLIIYLILRLATHILTDVYHLSGFVSGEYFDPAPPVEIRRRRENERKRSRKNMKIKRKGLWRREGSVMSVNSVGSTQSQPLPSTEAVKRTLDPNDTQVTIEESTNPSAASEANPHPSSFGSASEIRRNARPSLKNSASHPARASSDSFYGPLSPSSVSNSLHSSIAISLPAPTSARADSTTTPPRASQRPRLTYWSRQLLVYLLALLLMKLLVLLIFWIFPFLFTIGKWLLSLFGKHKRAQVVFSMAIFPLIMNVLQFWLIDTLLRHNPNTSSYSKLITEDADEIDALMDSRERRNGDGNRGQARESGEYDGEEYDDEETFGRNPARGSQESSQDHQPSKDGADHDDGWGWNESSRKSLEGLSHQARKGLRALSRRFDPKSTSNRDPKSLEATEASPSRKGLTRSLRFSDQPTFANESQTHLVGEVSDDDDDDNDNERGRTKQGQATISNQNQDQNQNQNQNQSPKPHAYPPSLEASPISSPRSSVSAKLAVDKDRGKTSLAKVGASEENIRGQGDEGREHSAVGR